MACPPVFSGTAFLSSTLTYVDCQAQSIGTFGFQALSAPNSTGAAVLGGLLVLFVALFGYRMLLGFPVHGRDVVFAVLKIGIVLTLATSWSSFRTLAYDTVLYGPAEIAGEITGLSDLSSRYALTDRLENVDYGIMALTVAGTGRANLDENETSAPGETANEPAQSQTAQRAFAAIAVDDQFGMGVSRVAYLAGTLAPLIAVRVAAGVLTALAPLFAGLLLFEGTIGIFFGWVRSLVAVALGSLALIISLSVELALLEPWLTDVIGRRGARLLTPAAPTELVVITTSFALVAFALLFIFTRLAFHSTAMTRIFQGAREAMRERIERTVSATSPTEQLPSPLRAAQIAERLTTIHRGARELTRDEADDGGRAVRAGTTGGGRDRDAMPTAQVPLGASYRHSTKRNTTRSSRAASTRDRRL